MTERSLDDIELDIDNLENEFQGLKEYETELNTQISDLRYKIAELHTKERELRSKRSHLHKEKESIERQRRIEEEQQQIEEELQHLREKAEALIKDAPWRETVLDWQVDGAVQLAAARRGLLADVRGMGKTLSSLAWRRAVDSRRTLMLTRNQYARELMREVTYWEPNLPVIPIITADPSQRKTICNMLKNYDDYIIIANFEAWRLSDVAVRDLLGVPFDGIILDEAHQLKTKDSATTQGFLRLAPIVPNLLEMTGTPVQNRPQELFTLLHILYPQLFPTENKFAQDYCIQLGQNRWAWEKDGLSKLIKKIGQFYVARTPEDVGHKVPPPAIHEYELDFEGYDEQREAYQFMAERALAKLKSGKVLNISSQLALMTRQAQLTSWPAGIVFRDEEGTYRWDIHQSVKLDWAEELIRELIDEEQRVVLFSRFKDPLFELQRRLDKLPVALITGETKNHAEIVKDFDLKTAPKNPRYSALLATYDTVGESVNLNAARHLIQLDRYWKPSRDDQAIGRVDRLNSMDQATVYRANVKKTIDDLMIEIINQKRNLINDFKSAAELQNSLIDNLEGSL